MLPPRSSLLLLLGPTSCRRVRQKPEHRGTWLCALFVQPELRKGNTDQLKKDRPAEGGGKTKKTKRKSSVGYFRHSKPSYPRITLPGGSCLPWGSIKAAFKSVSEEVAQTNVKRCLPTRRAFKEKQKVQPPNIDLPDGCLLRAREPEETEIPAFVEDV
ncbi:hypothetical protein Anapl_03659 [Anas platyrhynchos]|uniref:Uncharacterized protein n=1 Tax=Anas platyrhynchos TaxID=8839 RepID=R0K8G3_ANAPL|nr:hypothetical protein Anapl_03659 [Anas platyrhynchos]